MAVTMGLRKKYYGKLEVEAIIFRYMVQHNYTKLVNAKHECECEVDNLMPCGGAASDCVCSGYDKRKQGSWS